MSVSKQVRIFFRGEKLIPFITGLFELCTFIDKLSILQT